MSINDQILKDKLNNIDNLPCGDFLGRLFIILNAGRPFNLIK